MPLTPNKGQKIHERRGNLLEEVKKAVKKIGKREKKRLEYEKEWLETILDSGIDGAGQEQKATDTVLVLNELDDLLES